MRRRKGRAAALHEPAASAVAPLAPDVRQDMEPAEGSGGTDGRWRIVWLIVHRSDGRILGDLGPTARPTVRVVWRLATASPRPSAAKAWAAAVAAVVTARYWHVASLSGSASMNAIPAHPADLRTYPGAGEGNEPHHQLENLISQWQMPFARMR